MMRLLVEDITRTSLNILLFVAWFATTCMCTIDMYTCLRSLFTNYSIAARGVVVNRMSENATKTERKE